MVISELLNKLIIEPFENDVQNLITKYNQKLSQLYKLKPPFKEGDIVKFHTKDDLVGVIYKIHNCYYNTDFITKSLHNPRESYRCPELNIRLDIDEPHCHIVMQRLLQSKKWSKNFDHHYYSSFDEFYILDEKEYDSIKFKKLDLYGLQFNKVNDYDLDLWMLSKKIDEIISNIQSERYKNAMSRYCKSAMIPKSTIEKEPKIMEIHNMVEQLKSFKTKLNLTL